MKLIKNTQAIQSPSLQNHNSRESLNQMDRQDSIGVVDLDTKISDNSDLTEAPQITITDINIETNYGIAVSIIVIKKGVINEEYARRVKEQTNFTDKMFMFQALIQSRKNKLKEMIYELDDQKLVNIFFDK